MGGFARRCNCTRELRKPLASIGAGTIDRRAARLCVAVLKARHHALRISLLGESTLAGKQAAAVVHDAEGPVAVSLALELGAHEAIAKEQAYAAT